MRVITEGRILSEVSLFRNSNKMSYENSSVNSSTSKNVTAGNAFHMLEGEGKKTCSVQSCMLKYKESGFQFWGLHSLYNRIEEMVKTMAFLLLFALIVSLKQQLKFSPDWRWPKAASGCSPRSTQPKRSMLGFSLSWHSD